MKVILDCRYKFKKLEFCCGDMGDLIISGVIKPWPHTDHHPKFHIHLKDEGSYAVNYCLRCGAEIKGEFEKVTS